eukprot:6524823-Ditylum_brightwellii.AAC.1
MDAKEAAAAAAQETEHLVAELKGVECDKAKVASLQATQKLAEMETHPRMLWSCNSINKYLENLILEVEAYGGDVLKFCGDTFFAEWRYKSDGDLAVDDNDNNLLSSALCKAA